LIQPTSPAALTSGTKAETEGSAEEMIQPKKAPAPTKTGKRRLPSLFPGSYCQSYNPYRYW